MSVSRRVLQLSIDSDALFRTLRARKAALAASGAVVNRLKAVAWALSVMTGNLSSCGKGQSQ